VVNPAFPSLIAFFVSSGITGNTGVDRAKFHYTARRADSFLDILPDRRTIL
jgi:hypothetical protein